MEIMITRGYDVPTFDRFLEFLTLYATVIHFVHFLFLFLFLPVNLSYFLSSSFIAVRYTRCLLISLSILFPIFPFINLPIHLPFQHSTMYSCICRFSVCLSLYQPASLSTHPSICLSSLYLLNFTTILNLI
jgi:hypothetical protein